MEIWCLTPLRREQRQVGAGGRSAATVDRVGIPAQAPWSIFTLKHRHAACLFPPPPTRQRRREEGSRDDGNAGPARALHLRRPISSSSPRREKGRQGGIPPDLGVVGDERNTVAGELPVTPELQGCAGGGIVVTQLSSRDDACAWAWGAARWPYRGSARAARTRAPGNRPGHRGETLRPPVPE
jgi:hypothetical protein